MAILIRGRGTSTGRAVAARLEGAAELDDLARVAASSGVIVCGAPDAATDPVLVPRLIEVLAGSGKPLVYTSTAWVMGDTRGRLAGEAAPLRPPPSLAWLVALERVLLDAAGERCVRTVVVRPAVVYGAPDEGPLTLAEPRGENHWSFVHVEDLADLLVLAFAQAPAGSLFVAADGPPATRAELAAYAGTPGVAAAPEDAAALDQRVGSTRAFRELGWRPSRPPVLRWLAAAQKEQGGAEA